METNSDSSSSQYYYWLDKSCHQPFDFLGEPNLLFETLRGGSGSVLLTTKLAEEYKTQHDSLGISFDSESTGMVNFEFSEYAQRREGFTVGCMDIDYNEISQTLDKYAIECTSEADAEGVYLNLMMKVVTLTNDQSLINKILAAGSATPSFRPSHFLIANCFKGVLSQRECGRIWSVWRNHDASWVPKNVKSFDVYCETLLSEDYEQMERYFDI